LREDDALPALVGVGNAPVTGARGVSACRLRSDPEQRVPREFTAVNPNQKAITPTLPSPRRLSADILHGNADIMQFRVETPQISRFLKEV